MELQNILILFLFVHITKPLTLFQQEPIYSFQIKQSKGKIVKLFPDSNHIALAYESQGVSVVTLEGQEKCSTNLNFSTSTIKQIITLASNEFVTLDEDMGKAIRWSSECDKIYQWPFEKAETMAATSDGQDSYIAFNFGTKIQEYNYSSGDLIKTYSLQFSRIQQRILEIQYGNNYNILYTATTQANVYTFDCSSGQKSTNSFNTQKPIRKFYAKIKQNGQQIAYCLTDDNKIWKIESASAYPVVIPQSLDKINSFTVYPKNLNEIIIASSQLKDLLIYDYKDKQKFATQPRQTLFNRNGYIQDVDCNDNYSLSFDQFGNVNVYQLSHLEDKHYVFIIGGGIILLVGIIALVYIKCCRKKSDQRPDSSVLSQNKWEAQRPFINKKQFNQQDTTINEEIESRIQV